jgi:sugar lactone lactonase YvrE
VFVVCKCAEGLAVDAQDRLWVLDTGRPVVNNTMLLNSGGGKLLAFDLASNSSTPLKTIVFPLTVAYPETFLNDVRFDLRASATPSGQGVAYITDSSTNGRNGIIVVDLGTGRSWRHLDMHPSTLPEEGFVSAYDGRVFYPVMPAGPLAGVYSQLTVGSDGIALSAGPSRACPCTMRAR